MKREYTKQDIVNVVKRSDKRTETLTDDQIDDVINFAYAELSTVARLFTDEAIIPVVDYYNAGEMLFTIDVEDDVVYIYDLYLTNENQDFELYEHGIEKITDINAIYRDNRETGRVHINLAQARSETNAEVIVDNIIVKYFFTPHSTTESIFMDQPTFLALKNALSTALYDYMNDVERSMQKLSAMKRTGLAAIPNDPEDLLEGKPSMFPIGV